MEIKPYIIKLQPAIFPFSKTSFVFMNHQERQPNASYSVVDRNLSSIMISNLVICESDFTNDEFLGHYPVHKSGTDTV